MLKSLRNALFSSGSNELATRRFLFHGEDIAWSFVKDAHQRDLQRQARGDFRRCPKIKRDTVELKAWLKMRVPLAKHVLCYDRLRAEMKSYMQETGDQRPRATLGFLEHCDAMFGPFVTDLKVDSLGFTPSKQDVQRILTRLNMTRKTRSLVPGLSVPIERWAHLAQLRSFWFHPSQMIFVDEKKLKIGDIQQRCDEYVYSSINARPGLRVRGLSTVFTHAVTPRQEIAGALAYMPNRSLPLQDGRLGDVGLIDFVIQEPKLGIATTLHWITHDLVKHLTPYPGPCSLVILDNMPEHQKHKKVIEKVRNKRCTQNQHRCMHFT